MVRTVTVPSTKVLASETVAVVRPVHRALTLKMNPIHGMSVIWDELKI